MKYPQALTESKIAFNDRVVVGAAWNRGSRTQMQDALAISLDRGGGGDEIDFVGVFDGRGTFGRQLARYAAYKVLDYVLDSMTDYDGHLADAIQAGFHRLSESLRDKTNALSSYEQIPVEGGSTATTVWVSRGALYSASLGDGDSKVVVSYGGKAVAMSEDSALASSSSRSGRRKKKSEAALGRSRRPAGFFVSLDPGKARRKEEEEEENRTSLSAASALPDVHSMSVDRRLDFAVLASRGVWRVLGEQEVVSAVRRGKRKALPLERIASRVVDRCVAVDKEPDNMSVAIIAFRS